MPALSGIFLLLTLQKTKIIEHTLHMQNKKRHIPYQLLCFICFIALPVCCFSQDAHQTTSTPQSKKEAPKFIDDISITNNKSKIKIQTESGSYVTEHKTNQIIELPQSPEQPPKKDSNILALKKITENNSLQKKYANILGVLPTAITNLSLYSFIDDWYGVRYRMGGNDKNGIDCSAFVQRLYENVFCTNLVRTAFEQFNDADSKVKKRNLKEGDLVFFGSRRRRRRRISHVGIYLMNNFFVHASSSQGVIISSLDETYWAHKYVGAGEFETDSE